ncbi:MAG TPA: hypothetical protein DIC59_10830 [Candidatus Competibacteraceae bacterium]|nr:hypothetical protein [Candidatus Competibacteraceae bacterium]
MNTLPYRSGLVLGGGAALAAETGHAQQAAPAAVASKSVSATGTVKSIDAAAGKVVIDHDPIDALK